MTAAGLILHPDNEHLIFPLGCTVVVRNLLQRTQTFLQGHDNQVCGAGGRFHGNSWKIDDFHRNIVQKQYFHRNMMKNP